MNRTKFTIHKVDLGGGRMGKQQSNEIRGGLYFQMPGGDEDKSAENYWDKIKPTLVTADEYFNSVELKTEWYKRHEEKVLSEFYGVPVTITIDSKENV